MDNQALKNEIICPHCGLAGSPDDFEEDFHNHRGWWCPDCETFILKDEAERAPFTVILEEKRTAAVKPAPSLLSKSLSPLRYPGGKSRALDQLSPYFPERCRTFIEPFCGGASAGLAMLAAGRCEELWLNDLDQNVYAFWNAVFSSDAKLLCARIAGETPDRERFRFWQSALQEETLSALDRALGFFIVNRLSFSGIQTSSGMGNLLSRWNPEKACKKIEYLSGLREKVRVTNLDALTLIREEYWDEKNFLFIDPPYVGAGSRLYPVQFPMHDELATLLGALSREFPGCAGILVTYDACSQIKDAYDIFSVKQKTLGRRYSL